MAAFEYEAIDFDGHTKNGVISADTARLARRELRRLRLLPVKLEQVTQKAATSKLSKFGWVTQRGVRSSTLTLTTRQLATIISASAPIEEALHTVGSQAEDKTMRSALLSVRASVMEGFKLSDALAQHPHVFNSLYTALIAAGEESGNLGIVLERLADHLEKSDRLRSKVLAALIYPIVLTIVAATIVALLMVFVVPKVISQFDTLGQGLPLLTRMLVSISEGMSAFSIPVLVVFAVGGALFSMALKKQPFRFRVAATLLQLPVIGKLLKGLYAARLTRTLSSLVASGSPVVEGLGSAKDTIHNLVFRDALTRAIASIQEGASLSTALRRNDIFPPMVIYMASAGENSGRLDVMLGKAADHLENEFETFTSTAISLLEPLIIVLMGAVVATIVLAILLPILQLNSLALL